VNNCTFRNSAPYAIWLNEEGHFQSFENNTISNPDAAGIFINTNYVNTIGLTTTIDAKKELVIDGGVVKDMTLRKFSFPYTIEDWSGVGDGAMLTIEPGVRIEFARAYAFSMGMYDAGGMIANGTAEDPIVFTSVSENPAPDDWEHIYFGPLTLEGTTMNHCIVEYGGFNHSVGSIYIDNTNVPVISNCTVRNSGSYGISMDNATPTLTNITYSDNVMENEIQL
jgi:hypothetical protein